MRFARVPLIVGALLAGTVAASGSAGAAASKCYVVAKQDAPIFDASSLKETGKLKKGKTRDSACSVEQHEKVPNVVYLKGRKELVSKGHVDIRRR
ncbi:hypothetical protein [Allokutzneria sp. NRRL B-24872]|uniref:hypothetical protein n=1 Tax=Allokutzneria sp. NRRL B-24872 TaxID=1137961 RepID=UPI000A3D3C34|nr:hypothetical protein [Allokutzneria sp. NRRL B-24872]